MKPSKTSITTVSISLFAIALLFASTPANANLCTNPNDKTAQFICSNPQLKQIEEVISKSYFEKRSELSPMEQAEIERDQKLWLSYLKNCNVDENCIRDAFDQRLTDIQEFDKTVEAAIPADDEAITDDTTETADLGANEAPDDTPSEVADLGNDTEKQPKATPTTNTPLSTANKNQETASTPAQPSLITRFTGWLFPKPGDDAPQLPVKNTVPAAPAPSPSDMEIAANTPAETPATIVASPSDTKLTDTKPATPVASSSESTTDQPVSDSAKNSTAKPFVAVKTDKTQQTAVSLDRVNTTSQQQPAKNTTKPASESASAPTLMSKIKNMFLTAKPEQSSSPAKKTNDDKTAPVADIAKQGTPTPSGKSPAPVIAQQNPKNIQENDKADNKTAQSQQQQSPSLNNPKPHKAAHTTTNKNTKTRKSALHKARMRRRAQKKANIRWRAVMKRRRAAVQKRKAKKRAQNLAARRAVRKAQLRKRVIQLRAKKKAMSQRRKAAIQKKQKLKIARTRKIKNRKTVKSFALRSKNKKRIAKKKSVNKKSAAISYSFPAKALPTKSKYIKNSCKNCAKKFHLSHHLRDAY